jgi:hypothetical protein
MSAQQNRKMADKSSADYDTIRSRLVARKTSLRAWARKQNLPEGTVYKAAKGKRHGKQSQAIRALLEKAIA